MSTINDARVAGYAAAKKLDLNPVPGVHAAEAGTEARKYLMEQHKREFRAFIQGFEEFNRQKYDQFIKNYKEEEAK